MRGLAFSPDAKQLAVGGDGGIVRFYEVETGREVRRFTVPIPASRPVSEPGGDPNAPMRVEALSWSADGQKILTADDAAILRVWSAGEGRLERTIASQTHGTSRFALSKDGQYILSGGGSGDARADVREFWSGRVTHVLNGHKGEISALAWSPDGKTALSGAADKTLRWWNANSGQLTRTTAHKDLVNALAWSPDGKWVVFEKTLLHSAFSHRRVQLPFSIPFLNPLFLVYTSQTSFENSPRKIMRIGYARVSTHDQNLDLQTDALQKIGCERIYEDKISGTKRNRPGLDRALEHLREGDTLVVWKLDRLGRSVKDLVELVSDLEKRGIHFQSTTDAIDTSTPAGRFFFHVMASLAQMERELLVERTRAGLDAARAQGRIGGRKRLMTDSKIDAAKKLLESGTLPKDVAANLGVSVPTLYRWIPASSK